MASSPLVLRLASRNLLLNLRRSLLVGALIALAVVIAVIGGSLFDSTVAGLKRSFIESFTGDLFVAPKNEGRMSLFGVDNPVVAPYARIPTMLDYRMVLSLVKRQPGFAESASQISGYALLQTGATSLPAVLFGVDGGDYFKTFPAIRLLAGRALTTGVPGVMLSESQVREIGGASGRPLAPGDPIKLTAFTSRGFTIREVPLAGIFAFPIRNRLLDRIAYVDSGTLRSLEGMVEGNTGAAKLRSSDTSFLSGNLADVFSGQATVADRGPGIGLADIEHSLADTRARNRAVAETKGAWNFILIRLRAGTDPAAFARRLEAELAEAKLPVTVGSWRSAAGTGAALASSLATAFDVGLLLLAVVIVFVLVNTFTIWVTQRTAEIGTIRALGGTRGFVFRLFVAESALLSLCAGAAGLAIGAGAVLLLQHRGLVIHNRIIELIFGGSTLRPVLTAKALLAGLLGALAIGGVAVIFPIRLALRVQPLRAMVSE